MKKKILSKVDDYKLECDSVYHYFTSKTIKNTNVGKCWCRNKKEERNG